MDAELEEKLSFVCIIVFSVITVSIPLVMLELSNDCEPKTDKCYGDDLYVCGADGEWERPRNNTVCKSKRIEAERIFWLEKERDARIKLQQINIEWQELGQFEKEE